MAAKCKKNRNFIALNHQFDSNQNSAKNFIVISKFLTKFRVDACIKKGMLKNLLGALHDPQGQLLLQTFSGKDRAQLLWESSTLLQQPHPTLSTKSLKQQHANLSTSNNLQLMVANTPTSANVISSSCLCPNIWLSVLNMRACTHVYDKCIFYFSIGVRLLQALRLKGKSVVMPL